MATFGNTDDASATARATIDSGDSTTQDSILGSAYSPASSGTATKISVFIDFLHAGRQVPDYNVKCAIYTEDTVSETHDLLMETEERAFNATAIDGWYDFDLDSPVAVTGGNDYVLVVWAEVVNSANSIIKAAYPPTGSTQNYYQENEVYAGSWPDPWSANTPGLIDIAIFCTYDLPATARQLALTGVGT